jgi:YfiH family protein
MGLISHNNLEYFIFDSFQDCGVIHGLFTRLGGISPTPWSSLNLGGTVGDSRENIIENRARIFQCINRPVESVFDAWQVHGTHPIFADAPRGLDNPHQRGDIILTNRPEVTLLMRFADCVPIMLVDPVHRAIALVHAGWQGTVNKAAAVAVEWMVSRFNSRPKDILAGIGPSIGPDHYQIGDEVIQKVKLTFEIHSDKILAVKDDKTYFDLWLANQLILEQAGVRKIEISGLCTACDLTRWFSHRAENGKTGRIGAVLALE